MWVHGFVAGPSRPTACSSARLCAVRAELACTASTTLRRSATSALSSAIELSCAVRRLRGLQAEGMFDSRHITGTLRP